MICQGNMSPNIFVMRYGFCSLLLYFFFIINEKTYVCTQQMKFIIFLLDSSILNMVLERYHSL